ncbi:MAG TPA: hypothetical protein V6C76_12130 [Drouetiella sp.]
MSKLLSSFLAFVAVFTLLSAAHAATDDAGANAAKVRELPTVKAEKSQAGKDSNIKIEKATNSASKPKADPSKARSGWGSFRVYNKTGFYMDVYEDGTYVGTLAPWSYSTWVAFGSTTVYCKVVFDNGEFMHWMYNADVQANEVVSASPKM